jgi:hypothetical protein
MHTASGALSSEPLPAIDAERSAAALAPQCPSHATRMADQLFNRDYGVSQNGDSQRIPRADKGRRWTARWRRLQARGGGSGWPRNLFIRPSLVCATPKMAQPIGRRRPRPESFAVWTIKIGRGVGSQGAPVGW